MAQPTPYSRQHNFSLDETDNPSDPLPGNRVDLELNAIKQTLDDLLVNINLLQRDDGEVENRTIGMDQLTVEALTALGVLSPATVKQFIYDISAGGIQSVTGADRNGNTLAYVVAAPAAVPPLVGSQVDMYIDGVKEDPDILTHTDAITVTTTSTFPNPSVVVIEITEAQFVPTVDIEKLDDISGGFNGVLAAFAMQVGGQARVISNPSRLSVYLNDVPQEPVVDYTVAGSTITFTTPPAGTDTFWAITRTLVNIQAGQIVTAYLANLAVTNAKIADNTIEQSKLAFAINQVPVGGAVAWFDDVLPVGVAANTWAFPVGQTCGKCGSGAAIEDDDIEEVFDIFKKRWGNLGTEDFDNLDVVLLPDVRGTTMQVPDKGKAKVATNNAVGDQSGLEFLPIRALLGSATASGATQPHTLTIAEMPSHTHAITPTFAVGAGATNPGATGTADPVASSSATGGGGSHTHTITAVPVDTSNLRTNTDRVMQPYTVVEKIVRLK